MKYLTKPARYVFAIVFTMYKAFAFSIGLIVMFIWHLDLKFFDKWYLVVYNNFLELDNKFDPHTVVYRTRTDFILNRKSIINKH